MESSEVWAGMLLRRSAKRKGGQMWQTLTQMVGRCPEPTKRFQLPKPKTKNLLPAVIVSENCFLWDQKLWVNATFSLIWCWERPCPFTSPCFLHNNYYDYSTVSRKNIQPLIDHLQLRSCKPFSLLYYPNEHPYKILSKNVFTKHIGVIYTRILKSDIKILLILIIQ